MKMQDYSPATIRSYIRHLIDFARYFNRCPSELEQSQVTTYLIYLVKERGLTQSSINAAYSAIKLLFTKILSKEWDSMQLPRPRRTKILPVALLQQEVRQLFGSCKNVKHRTILMLVYCAGLRLSEVSRLRVRDIVVSRQVVFVRQGKGKKDRYSVLSEVMLTQLRLYCGKYRPGNWLFSGAEPDRPISNRTVQQIYKNAKTAAGLAEEGGIHQLRHSFATHLIEQGVSLPRVQHLMGHAHLRTTAIYLHISGEGLDGKIHPLDELYA